MFVFDENLQNFTELEIKKRVLMEKIDLLPWISHGRYKENKYEFFCAERIGQALETKDALIFSLKFSYKFFDEVAQARRLMLLMFLQEACVEHALHCDSNKTLWMNQKLRLEDSLHKWNSQVLWQLSTMRFFETQLLSEKKDNAKVQRGIYENLG